LWGSFQKHNNSLRMELKLQLRIELVASRLKPNSAAVIVDSSLQIEQFARLVAIPVETGGLATVAMVRLSDDSALATVAKLLPADCNKLAILMKRRQGADAGEGDSGVEQALEQALAGKDIGLSRPDPRLCHLWGLSLCWLSGLDDLRAPVGPLWHPKPPHCSQLVTHSPSWRLINERLARRMRRHNDEEDSAALKAGGAARGPAIVAEMGPRELTVDKIGLGANKEPFCRRLLTEPILGYRNLLGLARLSASASPPPPHSDNGGLAEFLASAAEGSLAKLDLTIGDLLPAESAYGQYDLGAAVFTLGKLHDLRSMEELKPSYSDIAASLSYAFIKTFFDTLVHAASAYGVPRVIVCGEFFESVACRDRLMEVWNFAGIPKDAMELHFLRSECADSLTLIGSLLQ
uniref:YqgFc domain-containing protein n=3 Tax=Macrostomum lignano TaxID=282301 RepID=A0A1I8GUU1_9PLAT